MNHSREYPDVELSCGVGDRILHTFTMMLKKANDNRQKLLKLLNASGAFCFPAGESLKGVILVPRGVFALWDLLCGLLGK